MHSWGFSCYHLNWKMALSPGSYATNKLWFKYLPINILLSNSKTTGGLQPQQHPVWIRYCDAILHHMTFKYYVITKHWCPLFSIFLLPILFSKIQRPNHACCTILELEMAVAFNFAVCFNKLTFWFFGCNMFFITLFCVFFILLIISDWTLNFVPTFDITLE